MRVLCYSDSLRFNVSINTRHLIRVNVLLIIVAMSGRAAYCDVFVSVVMTLFLLGFTIYILGAMFYLIIFYDSISIGGQKAEAKDKHWFNVF